MIVGIQPDVAFAMVQLGLTLEGVGTALDLEEGLAYLDEKTKRVEGRYWRIDYAVKLLETHNQHGVAVPLPGKRALLPAIVVTSPAGLILRTRWPFSSVTYTLYLMFSTLPSGPMLRSSFSRNGRFTIS